MLLDMNFKRTLYAENIEWETTQILQPKQKEEGKGGTMRKSLMFLIITKNVYSQKNNNRKRDGNRTLTR